MASTNQLKLVEDLPYYVKEVYWHYKEVGQQMAWCLSMIYVTAHILNVRWCAHLEGCEWVWNKFFVKTFIKIKNLRDDLP